jgi:hypothetical protein
MGKSRIGFYSREVWYVGDTATPGTPHQVEPVGYIGSFK